jgi:hypothetical protein
MFTKKKKKKKFLRCGASESEYSLGLNPALIVDSDAS